MADFTDAVTLPADGSVSRSGVVADHMPLRAAILRGFEELRDRPQEHLKVLIHP